MKLEQDTPADARRPRVPRLPRGQADAASTDSAVAATRRRRALRSGVRAAPSILGAVLCTWPAAPASAKSELRLYGVADVAIGRAHNGNGTSRTLLKSGQASSSRIGVRGSERLGGGLQLRFNLEAGLDVDTGTGSAAGGGLAFNRQSWVGLGGAFGELKLGRQYRPETRAVFVMDPFDGGSVASPPNTYSELVYRSDNAIVYETPSIANWRALVMVAPGERPNGARDDNGFALLYRKGPLRLAYGWDRRINAEASDGRVWQSLGGSYEAGPVTYYAAYRTRKERAAALDERSYWLGASVPMGAFTLRGVLGAVADRSPGRQDTTGVGVGLDYRLSARADLYGRYAHLRNRRGALFELDEDVQGSAPRSFVVGMQLRF